MTEVLVIGSGIGGLCCGALLARYGFAVTVCESHSIPGGAAHGFERGGFRFDSGPSLYSGLSHRPSSNPLRHVLDALDEDVDWVKYDTWGVYLPEGWFLATIGADQFCDVLQQLRGDAAVAEWRQLQQVMQPLGQGATALPPAALRLDWGLLLTTAPFLGRLLRYGPSLNRLRGPFSQILDSTVSDPFIRHWMDLLCFLLSGLPAKGTSAAEMAFMFAEWYRPGVQLDYPVGGSAALVNALVRGLERYGGQLRLKAHVEEILVDNGRAVGVRLRDGKAISASRAVIANISVWDMLNLLPKSVLPAKWLQRQRNTPTCDSFMHLHLGIDGDNLPTDLACHYIVVNNWEAGVSASQNVVLISIPSLLDPSLSPPDKHVIHVYTPGNEPYSLWQGLESRSSAYAALKQQRSQVMWQALERIIPDIRQRCELTLVGTPLTHARFLRRYQGSYGPAIAAGDSFFPGPKTPLPGLLCCGDSTFPGIGLPAVAASGLICAHTLAPVNDQLDLLRQIQLI